ncbi:MAG: family 43 glycosylhydrolase [bacterium]|nr:family 43 glycosylhydrolase [bacterium]
MRTLHWLLLGLLHGALVLACGTSTDESVPRNPTPLHNPVIPTRGLADPAVVLHEGTYFLYPTADNQGFDVYTSVNLRDWQRTARAINLKGPNVWAPDVFRDPADGRFYLYYSANYRVGVAVASDPEGPFEDQGILLEDAIDPHMFRDHDGKYYLYYESLADVEATIRSLSIPTGRIFVQPMAGPLQTSGEPRLLLEPDESWERGWFRIVEGPWMLVRDGSYYLMYSGNAAFNANYAIGYAVGPTPLGPFRKAPINPIAARGNGVFGPGHHSVVTGPDGELWMVYHQKASSDWAWDRFICIDRLEWDSDGALHVTPTPMRQQETPE